jgi:Sec-independent protein translocase protein TatA
VLPLDANLAIFSSLAIPEIAVIFAGAVILFGRQLPEVTMRGLTQVMKLRRAVADMWREAGLQDELRRVQHEVDLAASEAKRPSPALATGGKGPTERPRPVLEATTEPVGPEAEREPDADPDREPASD